MLFSYYKIVLSHKQTFYFFNKSLRAAGIMNKAYELLQT